MSGYSLALSAQLAAEEKLEALDYALSLEESSTDGVDIDWPDTEAPYCGCHTCVVREVLAVAWPLFQKEHHRLLNDAEAMVRACEGTLGDQPTWVPAVRGHLRDLADRLAAAQ